MNAPQTLTFDGPVTFDTYAILRTRLDAALSGSRLEVDWRAVDEVDSSALSLIFHGQRRGHECGCELRHVNLPGVLDALAKLYGVSDYLGASV